MESTDPWHEQDRFWEAAHPFLFGGSRLAETPLEVESILSLLAIEPGARILDLCCGVGRHALELARRGFRVTGVDRTQSYLEKAAEQAQREGLAAEFVHEDMRTFCRPDTFDAALNLFTSFGYFEDPAEDRQVAANVFRSLRVGGTFVLDLMGKEILARIFVPKDWDEEDGLFVLRETRVNDTWDWVENRWIMIKDDMRTEYCVSHRLYSAAELCALLSECGFARVAAYGDLAGNPYDHVAKRLVVVATR